MNSITITKRRQAPLTRGWKTLNAVTASLALLCAAPAFATTITFESIAPIGYAAGETINEGGFDILMLDGPFGGANGVIMDDSSCAVLACPGGATGQYLGVLNDGGANFALTISSSLGFTIGGFDFAFIAPAGGLPDFNYGRLQLSGLLANGTTITTALDFPGQNANSQFMFGGASLDSGFSSSVFKSLTINSCMFDDDLVCVNSVDNPAFYTAQFALDNLELNVVPEPVSLLLVGLGMGAMAFGRRRTVKPVHSNNLQAQGISS